MTPRAAGAACALGIVGVIVHGARLVWPGRPVVLAPAPACAIPVERADAGIECWQMAVAGVRAGDRVDRSGRVVGRMAPEVLAAFEIPIDPNRASADELASLPGIGPALAQRIVAERTGGGSFAT